MSEILVNTIKKADGTGGLTVPATTGTVLTTAGGVLTGDLTLENNGLYLGGTGAANKLEDYEEGTWTPTAGGTATYTHQVGHYTKVGRIVHTYFDIGISSIGTGGTINFSGLPFFHESGFASYGSIGYFNALATSAASYWPYIAASGTSIYLNAQTSVSAGVEQNVTFLQNSARIQGTIVYITSA